MNANVLGGLTSRKRPRARAVAALLPGVFALLLAGASDVAASSTPAATPTASPAPTPTPLSCPRGTHPDGTCCTRRHRCVTPPPTLTPTPTATPTPTSGGGGATNGGNGGSTPTPKPTATPVPTPKPSGSSGSSGASGGTHSGSHSGGTTGASGPTGATRVQVPADPSPFGALGSVASLSTGSGLDAARIPPVEALTPLSGLDFGTGLDLGPLLLLIDMIGIGLLVYLVRTRWLAPEA